MTIEEWNELTQNIVSNGTDLAVLTSLVTRASDAYNESFRTGIEQAQKIEQLTKENEGLRKANMDLFVRIGQQAVETVDKSETSAAEKITIDDLFKEE